MIDLDALDSEANLKPFRGVVGGVEFELVNSNMMSSDQVERYDNGDRKKVLLELLPEETGPQVVEALWKLKVSTLATFLNAWLMYGGVDLGEDEASAP